MKPVDQTLLMERDGEGDCLHACVASILELAPTVLRPWPGKLDMRTGTFELGDGRKVSWWLVFEELIEAVGYCPVLVTWWRGGVPSLHGWSIVSGPSPRDPQIQHSCVAFDGVIVHDPHPSRAGLRKLTDAIVLLRLAESSADRAIGRQVPGVAEPHAPL